MTPISTILLMLLYIFVAGTYIGVWLYVWEYLSSYRYQSTWMHVALFFWPAIVFMLFAAALLLIVPFFVVIGYLKIRDRWQSGL